MTVSRRTVLTGLAAGAVAAPLAACGSSGSTSSSSTANTEAAMGGTFSLPIEIDGKAVDATSAPVMFSINVGGYTSSSSWGATAQGGGMSAGNAAGGFGRTGGPGGAPGGPGGPYSI